jgi:hypothetical protein
MGNKPIIQNAQLTDEAGVAAVTVATGGEVTVGPGTYGVINQSNGGLALGGLSAPATNNMQSSRRVTLADDAVHNIVAGTAIQCILLVSNVSAAVSYAFVLRGAVNSTAIFVDYSAGAAVADTDGKVCVYYDGTRYVLKNRTGGSATFNITAINSEGLLG